MLDKCDKCPNGKIVNVTILETYHEYFEYFCDSCYKLYLKKD